MKAFIDYKLPGQKFWELYACLWENCMYQSVYQSPSFIRLLAEKFKKDFAMFLCYRDEELIGAAFFKKTNGVYYFLSEVKSDYNLFVLSNSCSVDEEMKFTELLMDCIKQEGWAVILKRQPPFATYTKYISTFSKQKKLFCTTSLCTVSPVLEEVTPEAIFSQLDKSRVRSYGNKLKREKQAEFEVHYDNTDLKEWVLSYTGAHIQRWKKTSTPSVYEQEERKRFLIRCLEAWHQDGVLVRFSIKVGNERIAHKIALRQDNGIISHSHTYDPSYQKYAPSKVLLRWVGKWMKNKGYTTFDFGYGAESYKYQFANKEIELNRIYISGYTNLPFIVKAHTEKALKSIRQFPAVYSFYRERIKPALLNLKMLPDLVFQKIANSIRWVAGSSLKVCSLVVEESEILVFL